MTDPHVLEENLVLTALTKQKGSEAQPGYKLRLHGNLPATAIGRENEAEPKLPQHGMLTLTSRNLFDGVRKVTLTGKLKRRFVAARKESPAFQVWDFRLANVPTRANALVLLELAMANGDDIQAAVEVSFTEQEEQQAPKVSEGPELFGDEADEIERIKNGETLKPWQEAETETVAVSAPGSLKQGEFEAEAGKKSRRRKAV